MAYDPYYEDDPVLSHPVVQELADRSRAMGEYLLDRQERDDEDAWEAREEEVLRLAEEHPQLSDPQTLEAVKDQIDLLADRAGRAEDDWFRTDPAIIEAALNSVDRDEPERLEHSGAYDDQAWGEVRGSHEPFPAEVQTRGELAGLREQGTKLNQRANELRREGKDAAADSVAAKALSYFSQAEERQAGVAARPTRHPDEQPMVVREYREVESTTEPSYDDRITEKIKSEGGDPDSYKDRTMAEISSISGSAFGD